MPRYNRNLATKRYVQKELAKDKWSKQYIATLDFDNLAVNAGVGEYYNISRQVLSNMIDEGIFTEAPTYASTDNKKIGKIHYKIDYIKIKIRTATGENETTSAVSQTVRMLLIRIDQNFQETRGGYNSIIEDVDGSVKYDWLFGGKFGLYWDKWKYVHSWATDGDTTAGGQVFFDKFKKIKYSDNAWLEDPETQTDVDKIDNEKGCIVLLIIGDDPTGTNSTSYGYVEVGWRYQMQ